MSKKIIWSIVIAVVTIAIAIGIYATKKNDLNVPDQDESVKDSELNIINQDESTNEAMSEQETYRNEKYGFEFQYPSSLIVRNQEGSNDRIVSICYEKSSATCGSLLGVNDSIFTISVLQNKENVTLKEFVSNRGNEKIIEETLIDNMKALITRPVYLEIGQKANDAVWVERNGFVYLISVNSEINADSVKGVFNNILSTFKSIK